MKKRIISFWLSVVFAIALLPTYVFAGDGMYYTYDYVYNNEGEKIGVSLSGTSGSASGTITLPSEYDGLPVVKINSLSAGDVQCYIIPSSVSDIDDWAFLVWDSALSSIEVASGNQHYKSVDGVLYTADMTELVCYPAAKNSGSSFSVPDGVKKVRKMAFMYNNNLSEVSIPSSVSFIGDRAFYSSQEIKAVNVDSGSSAFSSQDGVLYNKDKTTLVYCPGGVGKTFNVPTGVTTILSYAFDSSVIKNINLPSTVATIYSDSFNVWNHSVTVSNDNPNFKSIEGSVFSKDMKKYVYHHYNFEDSYTIPNGVTDIGKVFASCDYVSLSLPEGITSLCSSALAYSEELEEIHLPLSLKTIDEYVFEGCDLLKTVYYAGTTDQWNAIKISGSGNDKLTNAKIQCSNGTPVAAVDPEWSFFDNCLTVTYSGKMVDYARWENQAPWRENVDSFQITSIAFKGSPTTIGSYAFYELYRLNKIVIPSGITKIGTGAFENCALNEVSLPSSIKIIGDSAFKQNEIEYVYYAGSKTEWDKIEIGKNNESLLNAEIAFNQSGIPADTFEWKVEDGTLTVEGGGHMPDYSSTDIPWQNKANEITKVVVKGNFKNIGNSVFSGLTSLEEAVIPSSVKKLDSNAFANCSALKTITLPQKLSHIEDGAFENCSNLDNVVIPKTVKSVAFRAFAGCSKLKNLTISEGVVNFSSNCFRGCVSLSDVTLPKSAVVYNNIFDGCTSLKEVKVAEGNKSLTVKDGVLFGKDHDNSTTLLCYPAGKAGDTYDIPSDVTALYDSFVGNKYLKEITGGEGVKYISDAFVDCTNLSSIALSDTIESLSSSAFSGCKSFKKLVLPEGLTDFDFSLYGSYIEELTIPSKITEISAYELANSKYLKTINVVEGNTSYSSADGVLFSKDKKTLVFYPLGKTAAAYTTPAGVEIIGEYAFYRNSNLAKLVTSEDVRDIQSFAFSECSRLSEVIIKKGTETIGEYAFNECRSLSKITLPVSIKTIEGSAFRLDRSDSAEPVEVIYNGTQASWENIDVSWGNSDVYESENLSFVVGIGEGVGWILKGSQYLLLTGAGATIDFTAEDAAPWFNTDYEGDFLGYTHERIEAVWIDGGITAIGNNSFTSSYTNLTDVFFDGSRAQWNAVSIGSGNTALKNATVHCNDDSLGDVLKTGSVLEMSWKLYDSGTLVVSSTSGRTPSCYRRDYDNACFPKEIHKSIKKVIVEEGITTIGEETFSYLPMLYKVQLPSTIKTIEDDAFYHCQKLTKINFPSSLTTIKGFSNCSLREFNIPEGVTVLEDMSYNLFTTATIPDSVATISCRFFSGCTELEEINIGKNTKISVSTDSDAFYDGWYMSDTTVKAVNVHPDNPQLYSVDGVLFSKADKVLRYYPTKKEDFSYTTPAGTKGIGSHSFTGIMDNLLSLTISEGVEFIEPYGIHPTEIKEINLPTTLKTIEDCGICGSVEEINISEGLEKVGSCGVSSDALKKLILPKSLKEIGDRAFSGCTQLESVSIPEGVTSIGINAFKNCSPSFTVKIPASVTKIGPNAFYNDTTVRGHLSLYYGGTKEKLDEIIADNSKNERYEFGAYGGHSYYCKIDGYKHIYRGDSENEFGIFIDEPIASDSVRAGIEYSKNGVVTETDEFNSYDVSGIYYRTYTYINDRTYDADTFKVFAYDSQGNALIEPEIYTLPLANVAISTCTSENGQLSVKLSHDQIPEDCTIMLAVYDDDGRLVGFYKKTAAYGGNETSFNVSTDKDLSGMKLKVFPWESLGSVKPVGVVAEQTIE